MRRPRKREELIQAVADAWNAVDSRSKVDLMVGWPDLYYACAWLAAHETVTKEMKRR